jgi:hypothetical protein
LLQLGDKGPERRKKILVERQNAPVLTGEDHDRNRCFGTDLNRSGRQDGPPSWRRFTVKEYRAKRWRWE